ncbi:MAG: tetratricopeptide repeat protein [Acidobacteriales bacterium]|nr:tetratricopeptide repeat protein [Terriglobales bacterium]
MQEHALSVWKQAARIRPVNLAIQHANLSLIYVAQGKLSAAEDEAGLARELSASAPQHEARPIQVRVETLLAKIEYACGRYVEAEQHQKVAVEHFSSGTASNPADAATAMNDMAMMVAAQGEFGRARPFAERALEILRQAGRATDVDYWRLAGNLALICYRLGDFPAADALYRDSIAGLDAALGNDYPHLGVLLGEYAQLLRKTGRKAEAKDLERRAKAILTNANLPGRHTIDARVLTK